MNRKTIIVLNVLTIAVIALSLMTFPFPAAAHPEDQYGPKTDELLINFYADVEAAYGGLKTCDIDLVMYDITADLYKDAIKDASINLAPIDDMGMYEVDINNNYTVATYPGVRNPLSEKSFRQACACLMDKDVVVDTYCGGFAKRIDVPVAPPTSIDWVNTSMVDTWTDPETGKLIYFGNYPYKFSGAAAQALYDANGFVTGDVAKAEGWRTADPTTNPYYDADKPWSQEYLRVYPEGWPNEGEDIDKLVCCWRNDDTRRLYMGRMLSDNMRKSGIPCDVKEGTMAEQYGPVMGVMDYHMYTGGWSLGRYPTYIYSLYHSQFWYPYGPNYVTALNSTGDPNYPLIDQYATDIWITPNMTMGRKAAQKAEGALVDECVCIWVFGSKAFWAYKNLLGVVNMFGVGPENDYGFMNMFPKAGGPLKVGLITPPYQLNILMSSWYYDRQVMDRTYEGLFAATAPYNRARDQPWTTQDWSVSEWCDPQTIEEITEYFHEGTNATTPGYITLSKKAYEVKNVTVHFENCTTRDLVYDTEWNFTGEWCDQTKFSDQVGIKIDLADCTDIWIRYNTVEAKTKVSVWFRKDIKWITPETGAVYGPVTTDDYTFSVWFALAFIDAWNHDDLIDIHHIEVVDAHSVEVYMDSKSYWLQYEPGTYVLPSTIWKAKFCYVNTTSLLLPEDVHSCNKTWLGNVSIGAGQILDVVSCTLDLVPLEEGIDFEIVNKYDDHTWFHWLRDATAGQTLTITYWTIDPAKPAPRGYIPGDYEWGSPDNIFTGMGQWYLVDLLPGKGGHAGLKANRNYWLKTPVPACPALETTFGPAEVDWVWEWGDRDASRPTPNDPRGPRKGHYIIDISDVVMCTGAYGSKGSGVPTVDWKTGPDFKDPVGEIDISDVVSITGRYGCSFGTPP